MRHRCAGSEATPSAPQQSTMSTGIKLKLKIGGHALAPRPAGLPDHSPAPPQPLHALGGSSQPAALGHEQHKEKKRKKKRHREEGDGPARPSGGAGPHGASHAFGASRGAVAPSHAPAASAAPPHARALLTCTCCSRGTSGRAGAATHQAHAQGPPAAGRRWRRGATTAARRSSGPAAPKEEAQEGA